MQTYDVIVVGAGTWGSATAWHLARRGVRVLAIDAHTPPHEHGSHGGLTRLARQSNSTGPQYVQLTVRAFELWDQLAARTATELMTVTGNVMIGEPGSPWFDSTVASLESSPFEHRVLHGEQARAAFPRLRIADHELAVFEPEARISHVPAALRAMQQVARESGAQFRFDEPVLNWSSDASGVRVRTAKGEYVADRLVMTTGAFSAGVLHLDLPARVDRQVLVNFAMPPEAAPLPSIYVAGPAGSAAAPDYGCMEPDGTWKFSVASNSHEIDPSALSQDVTPEDIAKVTAVVRDRIPEITGPPVRSTVCMWTEAVDGHWLLGPHPDNPRVVVGAACNGRGFRYAPAIGEILADLTEGTGRPDVEAFAPARFSPTPSLRSGTMTEVPVAVGGQHTPVALITGGGSGIGAATASVLCATGWSVVICGRRAEALRAVAEATGAHPIMADVTDPDGAARLIFETVQRHGRLDGLVLNAGIVRPGAVGDLADHDWEAMVATNLTAPYRLLRAALPQLLAGGGAIVGVASISALRASGGIAGYNATKAGLTMLLQSVAVDYGPRGVRANVVCPGWTRTEMADEEMAALGKERGLSASEAYRLATALVPLGRPAAAAEVAAVVAHLLSPAASYINAAVVPVDGGHSAVDVGAVAFDLRVTVSVPPS